MSEQRGVGSGPSHGVEGVTLMPDYAASAVESLASGLRAKGYLCRPRQASEFPQVPFAELGLVPHPHGVLEVFHRPLVRLKTGRNEEPERCANLFLASQDGTPICLIAYGGEGWRALLVKHLKEVRDAGPLQVKLRSYPMARETLARPGAADRYEPPVPSPKSGALYAPAAVLEAMYEIDTQVAPLGLLFAVVFGGLLDHYLSAYAGLEGWHYSVLAYACTFGLWAAFRVTAPWLGPILRARATGERVEDVRQLFPWKESSREKEEEQHLFDLHALLDPDPRYQPLRDAYLSHEGASDEYVADFAAELAKHHDRERLEQALEWITGTDMYLSVVRALGKVGDGESARKLRVYYGQRATTPKEKIATLEAVTTLEGAAAESFLSWVSETEKHRRVRERATELLRELSPSKR